MVVTTSTIYLITTVWPLQLTLALALVLVLVLLLLVTVLDPLVHAGDTMALTHRLLLLSGIATLVLS